MTFNQLLEKPQSKKITICEIDTPLSATWINYQAGIWFTRLTPGNQLVADDRGNFGYWGTQNTEYFNIQSLNIDGELYPEVASVALCISTNKSWYYDASTTDMYIHLDAWQPPEVFQFIRPGAVIGFTNNKDAGADNEYENIYYYPLINSVPNLSKKKDPLFFGLLQFQVGSVTFDNTSGFFDDFATRDLYNQPIRFKLTFEGLPLSESLLVYTGRVEDFTDPDFSRFVVNIADQRKQLSRKLPVNVFTAAEYPNMEDKLIGLPIPISFGPVIKAPAYKTDTNTWKFADTTFNAIDSTIIVYNGDDTVFTHGGTITDGTFTGSQTGTEADNKLKVSFTQSVVQNGLDVIADNLQNYESVAFSALNYDLVEWNQEKTGVANMGLWLGKGNIKSTVDVIEQVCTDNQGIFEPLADGRNTFRTYNPGKMPTHEIFQDELLSDPSRKYDSEEFLSSVTVEYAKDIKAKDPQMYTNSSLEHEVFGRYSQRKGKIYKTALTTEADALTLTDDVMALSKFILPNIGLRTKIQNISLRILDNIMYEHKRQNGKIIIPQSKYQTLGVGLNLTTFELNMTVKQIEEDNTTYRILDGGTPTTDYDYYDGGTPSARPTKIYRGRTF